MILVEKEEEMKKTGAFLVLFSVCFLFILAGFALAQEDTGDVKAVLDTAKDNAASARQEEKDLREQINQAIQSGDMETAKALKEQLKTMHQENIEQKKEDLGSLRESRQELKSPNLPDKMKDPQWRKDHPNAVEAVKDRKEDFRDRKEDVRDRREDIRDRKEDAWDRTHNYPKGTEAYRRDKMEDVRDRREDVRDRKEDFRDKRR